MAGVTIACVGATSDLFGRSLPPPWQVAGRAATPANVDGVRTECMRSAPIVLGIGVGASLLVRSAWPAIATGLTVAWLWWTYERAARTPGDLAPPAGTDVPRSYPPRRWVSG